MSELRFTGAGDGLVVASSTCNTQPIIISDLSITTTQQEPGTGVSVSCTGSDLKTYGEFSFGQIDHLDVRGVNFANSGWIVGIHTTDFVNAWIRENNVIGRRDINQTTAASFQFMTGGIVFSGSGTQVEEHNGVSSPVDATPFHVLFNHVYSALVCFQDNGYVEGGEYLINYAVGCGIGFNTNRLGQRPAVRYDGNHANVFQKGIYVGNTPQSWVTNNLIYKNELSKETTTGLILESSSETHVSGNQFQNQGTDGSSMGNGDWMGMLVSNSPFVQLDNNVCDRPTNCLTISGASTYVQSRHTESLGAYLNATPMESYIDTSGGQNDRIDGPVVVATLANTAVVTTNSTSALVASPSYSFSNVEAGQNYIITGSIIHMQGADAGIIAAGLTQVGGTATVSFGAGLFGSQYAPASAQTAQTFTAIAHIAAGGTLQLGLQVRNSGGAGGTISINGLQLSIVKQ